MDTTAVGNIGGGGLTQPMPVASTGPVPAASAAAAQPPAPAARVAAVQTSDPALPQVQAAIARTMAALQPDASNIEFSIDQSTGKTIVRMVDAQTGDVIRQIPSEEMIEIARSIDRTRSLMAPSKA